MEKLRDIVCKNFNELVDSSPLTKREIARLLNVSEATMQRWGTSKEKGGNPPTLDNIEALAEILKIDPLAFYKTNTAPAPLTMPVSKTLQRLMAVPDSVYNAAERVSINNEVWRTIEGLLGAAAEIEEEGNGKAKGSIT